MVASTVSIYNWLLFIHHIPSSPAYLRVKVARKLAHLGAVALKNAVYVLPDEEQQRDALTWLAKEIEESGGRAFVCYASFSTGNGFITDEQVRVMFIDSSQEQYALLYSKAKVDFDTFCLSEQNNPEVRQDVINWLIQLRRQYESLRQRDFFQATGSEGVVSLITMAERWLEFTEENNGTDNYPTSILNIDDYQGRVWVTRPSVQVDRIASSWFIRRFIDKNAVIRTDGIVNSGEISFDLPAGDFTHNGNACTFEMFVRHFGLANNKALVALASLVHDIDLSGTVHVHTEASGVAALLSGLAITTENDAQRLDYGACLFDALLAYYNKKY